jgi:hypothetical protein
VRLRACCSVTVRDCQWVTPDVADQRVALAVHRGVLAVHRGVFVPLVMLRRDEWQAAADEGRRKMLAARMGEPPSARVGRRAQGVELASAAWNQRARRAWQLEVAPQDAGPPERRAAQRKSMARMAWPRLVRLARRASPAQQVLQVAQSPAGLLRPGA